MGRDAQEGDGSRVMSYPVSITLVGYSAGCPVPGTMIHADDVQLLVTNSVGVRVIVDDEKTVFYPWHRIWRVDYVRGESE